MAVADTGTAGHYLTLDSPCDNNKTAVSPLPVRMPNGEITTSTHTALLSKTDVPIEARKAHLFPGLNKDLLSIGTFCDYIYQSVFDDKKVLILNKGNGKIMMKGRWDPLSNLYMINLTQSNNLMAEFQTHDECFAGNVYECKSKGKLVDYHHASQWSPTQSGRVKAITKNFFTSWPGLSSELVLKYLNNNKSNHHGTS